MSCAVQNLENSFSEESLMGRGISIRKSSEYCARQPGPSFCRTIPLTQGKFTTVDDEDFERLSKWKWHACQQDRNCYAMRQMRLSNGQYRTILMHRDILNPPPGTDTDHKDHNGLNNRRTNLRIATRAENQHNRRLQKGPKTSRFKGVSWHKACKEWQVQICVGGKHIHLGCFHSEEKAARAYDKAAVKYFGEFAYVNFSQVHYE